MIRWKTQGVLAMVVASLVLGAAWATALSVNAASPAAVKYQTVSAKQSGSWHVAVDGAPTVRISPDDNVVTVGDMPPVAISPSGNTVAIGNPASNPARVREVTDKTYFHVTLSAVAQPSSSSGVSAVTPTGSGDKWAVLRTSSVQFSLPASQMITYAALTVTVNSSIYYQVFPSITRIGSNGDMDYYQAMLPADVVMPGNASVQFSFNRSSTTGTARAAFDGAGYYTDNP